MLDRLKATAIQLKREVIALYVAARDKRTPLAARIIAWGTAGYALSPIDLIPDFIPVLGLLDDLVIVPLGIWIALRLIPEPLMTEYREVAARFEERPNAMIGPIVVAAFWLFAIAALALIFL